MSNQKITPAMRKWCQKLADPAAILSRTGDSVRRYSLSPYLQRKPSAAIIEKMQEIGLIEFTRKQGALFYAEAQLTEKGMKIAKGDVC